MFVLDTGKIPRTPVTSHILCIIVVDEARLLDKSYHVYIGSGDHDQ